MSANVMCCWSYYCTRGVQKKEGTFAIKTLFYNILSTAPFNNNVYRNEVHKNIHDMCRIASFLIQNHESISIHQKQNTYWGMDSVC